MAAWHERWCSTGDGDGSNENEMLNLSQKWIPATLTETRIYVLKMFVQDTRSLIERCDFG